MGSKTVKTPKRGDVYLVDFDPTRGAEIRKRRPAVVIQNDVANRYSPIVIVAAVVTRKDDYIYPTEVRIDPPEAGLDAPSMIRLSQIRSVDKVRLTKRLGKLSGLTLRALDNALAISIGLVDV